VTRSGSSRPRGWHVPVSEAVDPYAGFGPEELLEALEQAAGMAALTRQERDYLIRRCTAAGVSSQRVADVAGVSKTQAWRIGRAE
jgi:hypothetical protein